MTKRLYVENADEWKPSDGSDLYKIDAEGLQKVRPLSDERYQFWRDVYCVN